MGKPVLTPLMARVLARHASGISLKQIATEIYSSERSVWALSEAIKKRLEAKNLTQATLRAHQLGYITLPDENGIVCSQSPYIEQS